jgi:NADPH2:quinone reductase
MNLAVDSAAMAELPLPTSMRAVVYDDYGDADVLHLSQCPTPRPTPGKVLIEVQASSVNPIDYRLRRGEMKGLLPGGFPRIPGYDVAGVVVACDRDADLARGDRVLAFLDHLRGGACADYACCGRTAVAKIPDAMATEQAAAIPLAGTTALQSLRDHGRIQPRQRVLINGASGGVGMFAVQIAKSYDCDVTAVASGANEEFCLSLGADKFFDYRQTDFTQTGEQWDLIFDAAGKASFLAARKVLSRRGRFVSTEPDLKGILLTLLTWPLSKSARVMLAKPKAADLVALVGLYEAGKLRVTIDSRFPFADAAEAHRRIETGVDRGKVVIVHRDVPS